MAELTTPWLHGLHDAALADLMADKPGTLLITEAIGADPRDHSGGNYTRWTSAGYRVIVRLNNGYGSTGSIPSAEHYQDFATRCANYVGASPGCDIVIIGNETNHENERPGGQIITPTQYAKCYDLCYQAIKAACPRCQIGPAPVAPWDATTRYPGNDNGDWIQYFEEELLHIGKADFIALHTYTHGSHPSLIVDESRMDAPFVAYHYNFRAYQDFIRVIPHWFNRLPIYITESNQTIPWLDQNNGWVQAAYAEIDRWNDSGGQPIHALCLYRSNEDDQWSFTHKRGVQEDFRAAMAHGYTVDATPGPGPTPPDRPEPLPPTTPEPVPEVDWDARLSLRGCTLQPALIPNRVAPRVQVGRWFNEQEAQGRVNIYVRLLDQQGNLAVGVPVTQFWSSGSQTKPTERKSDPWLASKGLGAEYSLDFAMYEVAPSYGIRIDDGNSGDIIDGCGLGSIEQPDYKIHTAYFFEWQLSSSAPPPPVIEPIPPPAQKVVHPLPSARITQHFGVEGLHHGIDLAMPQGTPIACIAFGVVVYSAFDNLYGWYCRVEHPELGCFSFYSHLVERGLAAGTVVQAGDTIGKVGSTGNSTGPHLHFEIRARNEDGSYNAFAPLPNGRVDPESFLALHNLKL